MNTSACIIAACAANARARKKEEPEHIPAEELYYHVMLRKYFYFKPMTYMSPIQYNESIGTYSMSTTYIEAKTFVIASNFSVKASKCINGIDAYIRDNLDSIISMSEWKARDAQVLSDYLADIKKQYDVDIDPAYVNYTTEYYWEVS